MKTKREFKINQRCSRSKCCAWFLYLCTRAGKFGKLQHSIPICSFNFLLFFKGNFDKYFFNILFSLCYFQLCCSKLSSIYKVALQSFSKDCCLYSNLFVLFVQFRAQNFRFILSIFWAIIFQNCFPISLHQNRAQRFAAMSSCGQDSRVFSATVNEVKKISISGDMRTAISHDGC